MATTDTFSSVPGYYLDVYAAIQSQNSKAGYSTIYYRVRVYKTTGGGYYATTNNGNSGWADSNVGGTHDLWNDNNLAFDFRAGGNGSFWTFSEGTFNVQHAANGSASYSVSAGMTLFALGKASVSTGTRSIPSLGGVPPAPRITSLDNITQTSIDVEFKSNGDGGSTTLQWNLAYSTSASSMQHIITSNGTSTISGLLPGTDYFFWARGRNANGWGAWTPRSTAQTLGGVRIKDDNVWKDAKAYVKMSGVWRPAQVFQKVGTTWKPTV